MILCLSFERGMVDACNPGLFPVLGHRPYLHCTCGEIRNIKQTLPAPAANGLTQGRHQVEIRFGRPGASRPGLLRSGAVFLCSLTPGGSTPPPTMHEYQK